MSKPSDDLSALFRSLRPDESVFQESTNTGVREAEQRWPLFKAVAPEKPQETPALSPQERQRWVNQDKPVVNGRKPALSLPGLSDKMTKGLEKMSVQAVKNTAIVKPAVRREPEKSAAERVVERPIEPTPGMRAAPASNAGRSENRVPIAAAALPVGLTLGAEVDRDADNKRPAVPAPALSTTERGVPASGRRDESIKSIFSRLGAKTEVVVKPATSRSSFLDRLGKR